MQNCLKLSEQQICVLRRGEHQNTLYRHTLLFRSSKSKRKTCSPVHLGNKNLPKCVSTFYWLNAGALLQCYSANCIRFYVENRNIFNLLCKSMLWYEISVLFHAVWFQFCTFHFCHIYALTSILKWMWACGQQEQQWQIQTKTYPKNYNIKMRMLRLSNIFMLVFNTFMYVKSKTKIHF